MLPPFPSPATGSFGDLTLKSSIVIQHDYDEVEQSWGRREVTLSWSPMRIKAAGALLQLERSTSANSGDQ